MQFVPSVSAYVVFALVIPANQGHAEAGFGHWRRATETPFNLVLEARA